MQNNSLSSTLGLIAIANSEELMSVDPNS